MKAPVDAPFNVTDALEKFPKILDYTREHAGAQCIAFEKHDGTNLAFRLEDGRWSVPTFRSGRSVMRELGVFRDAVPVFESTLRSAVDMIARHVLDAREAVFFAEFRGDRSFSGEHEADDEKRLHPIDLWIKGRGFVPPERFAREFAEFVTPIYRGKLSAKFVEDVRAGRKGVNEGVVCKGGDWGEVWCCKIKTRAWLARGGEA